MGKISSNTTTTCSMTAQQEKSAEADFLKAIVNGELWKNSSEQDAALNGSCEALKPINATDNGK